MRLYYATALTTQMYGPVVIFAVTHLASTAFAADSPLRVYTRDATVQRENPAARVVDTITRYLHAADRSWSVPYMQLTSYASFKHLPTYT